MLKRSYPGTSNRTGIKISDDRFITGVSGTLKWDFNQEGFFSGSFKQETSVTGTELTIENVVKRGCYFSHASQLIGIVISVGQRTIDSGKVLKTRRDHELVQLFRDTLNAINFSGNGEHTVTL